MKALVIGASGLVGGALVAALERAGVEAVGTGCRRAHEGGARLDVSDRAAVQDLVAQVRPDVVFLAVNAPGGADACEAHPDQARAILVEGTRHVAEAVSRAGARLVHYSTDYIFDGQAGPYDEAAAPAPVSAYGRMKLEAEQIIHGAVPRALILRTTAVFGWDRASTNLAMQVWQRLQAGTSMRVPADQWCNPTLAESLAEASVRLVQVGVEGIVNVVGKDRMTRASLAQALARAMTLPPDLIEPVPTAALGQRAARPLQGGLTTARLERWLGTEPLDLPEALKRFRRQWRAGTHTKPAPRTSSPEADEVRGEILDRVRRYYELAHQPPPFVPYQTRVQYAGRVYGAEELLNLVDSALEFWLTMGSYGDLFEQKMKQFFGARDFVFVSSGSTANLTAVLALMSAQLEDPLRPGDEVLTPAVTFPTTLAPLVHSGLIPVFVDCGRGTYNIDPHQLEDAVSPRTRAILIPHTLGMPCDMDAVCEVARRHRLRLVEDTCDALGATFRGRLVGTFGDLATVSFFPAHHITTGEGGGVIVNTARLSRIVRSVRDWGRDCWCATGESNTCGTRFGWQLGGLPKGYDHKYTYSNLGYNFKPTDLQAAIGAAQAERIAGFVAQRRRNFTRLAEGLARYATYLELPTVDARADPSWFGLPLLVRGGLSRRALVQWLESANIETRQVFAGHILQQPAYQQIPCRIHGTLQETDRIMRDAFFIGVYPGLTDRHLEFVLETFTRFFAQYP